MLSTPAPIPTSIMPVFSAFAISTTACKPLEHCLFKLRTAVDSGNPATSDAARNSVAPPPGGRTEPTATSLTSLGSMPLRSMTALKTPASRSAAAVSLKPPLPPLVMAERRAHVTTMSSGCFSVRPAAPLLPPKWEETWVRRCWARDG